MNDKNIEEVLRMCGDFVNGVGGFGVHNGGVSVEEKQATDFAALLCQTVVKDCVASNCNPAEKLSKINDALGVIKSTLSGQSKYLMDSMQTVFVTVITAIEAK